MTKKIGGEEMGKENLLILREKGLMFCKTYEKWLRGVGKFILTVYMLAMMSHKMGHLEVLTKSYVIMGIGLLSMLVPSQYVVAIVGCVVVAHLLAANIVIGAAVAVIGVILYVGYVRFWPKESIWILLTWAAFELKAVVCLIPIIAGLFSSVAAVGAMIIGVFIYYLGNVVHSILQNIATMGGYGELIKQSMQHIQSNILFNEEMFSMMIILMIVFLTVFLVKKQPIDYAPYIAIMLGGFMMIMGFGLGILFLNLTFDIVPLILVSGVSIVISLIVQAMVMSVDYTRTETVEFEDEQNIYYVKIVPKVVMPVQKQKVECVYTANNNEQKEMF